MPELPRKLNLGSGKKFKPDCLNVDSNPYWQPDLAWDLETPFPPDGPVEMVRFGTQIIPLNYFDEIIAEHLLEHIRNLTELMTCCLHLLRNGGVMRINVPYDLSYGAWQDPTHVRALNERSWWYYTKWFWHLGWTEARFDLVYNQFLMNEIGNRLKEQGMPPEDIIRQPRVVDEMAVVLQKRPLTADEKAVTLAYLKRPDNFNDQIKSSD